jgi:Flp pilus assembly protein TadG
MSLARRSKSCRVRSQGKGLRFGAAAVELALLLPFLAGLFVAGVDLARVFYYSQIVENCARNGALYLSDPKAPAYNLYASVSQAALADASGLSPQPTVTSTSGTDISGNKYVSVTVNWTFNLIAKAPGVPTSVNLSRTVQMRTAP